MIDHQEEEEKEAEKSSGVNSGSNWNGSLKKTLNNSEIISQAIIFLIAGFETTAINLGFIAYNLAKCQESQDKLCSEIDHVLDKHVYYRFKKNLFDQNIIIILVE